MIMYFIKKSILMLFPILLICCGNKYGVNQDNCSLKIKIQENQNTDPILIEKNQETIDLSGLISMEEYEIYEESMIIISNDVFLSYPFGIYDNLKEINEKFTGSKKIQEYEFYYLDSLFLGSNILVFFLEKIDTNAYESGSGKSEIVYSKIVNSNITLANGIQVGMSKDNFFKYLDISLSASQKNSIKVVFFDRLILGVWQSYYFSENKLDSVIITTDYEFDHDKIITTDYYELDYDNIIER